MNVEFTIIISKESDNILLAKQVTESEQILDKS